MNKLICQKCGNKENATNNVNICSNCEKIKRLEQAKIICRSIGLTVLIMFIPLLIFPILKGTNSSGYYELPVEVGKSFFSYQMLVLANILLILLAVISFGLFIFFKLKIKNASKVICFLLFFALTIPLLGHSKSEDALLFEINRNERTGIRYSSDTFYFYQSGRISCKAENNTDPDRKLRKIKINKCLHISQTKINELTELAKQTDFQTSSYQYFNGGVDWGKSFSITYFDRSGNKKIILTTPKQAKNPGIIPPSLTEFLDRIGSIDKRLKVSYGLPNKITLEQ